MLSNNGITITLLKQKFPLGFSKCIDKKCDAVHGKFVHSHQKTLFNSQHSVHDQKFLTLILTIQDTHYSSPKTFTTSHQHTIQQSSREGKYFNSLVTYMGEKLISLRLGSHLCELTHFTHTDHTPTEFHLNVFYENPVKLAHSI